MVCMLLISVKVFMGILQMMFKSTCEKKYCISHFGAGYLKFMRYTDTRSYFSNLPK